MLRPESTCPKSPNAGLAGTLCDERGPKLPVRRLRPVPNGFIDDARRQQKKRLQAFFDHTDHSRLKMGVHK